MKKRPAKPPVDPQLQQEEMIKIRITAYDRQQFELASNKANLSMQAWMRDRLEKAAKREL